MPLGVWHVLTAPQRNFSHCFPLQPGYGRGSALELQSRPPTAPPPGSHLIPCSFVVFGCKGDSEPERAGAGRGRKIAQTRALTFARKPQNGWNCWKSVRPEGQATLTATTSKSEGSTHADTQAQKHTQSRSRTLWRSHTRAGAGARAQTRRRAHQARVVTNCSSSAPCCPKAHTAG